MRKQFIRRSFTSGGIQLLECILIIALSLCYQFACAQIIYTDITDITISGKGGKYNLDLNRDGINDFIFSTSTNLVTIGCQNGSGNFTETHINAKAQPNNLTLDDTKWNSDPTVPSALSLNAPIDSGALTWGFVNATLHSVTYSCHLVLFYGRRYYFPGANILGDWSQNSTNYLGVRFHAGSDEYFGWVHLRANSDSSLSILDYAYNSIPGSVILAGDTGSVATGIHNIQGFSSIAISPNAFQHLTRISFSLPKTKKTSIIIYDLAGRAIKILVDEMMSAGNHQLQWNATDENGNAVSAGIYFLKIQSQDFSQTEKLMVTK